MDVTALLRRALSQHTRPQAPSLQLRSASNLPTSAESATTVRISESARFADARVANAKASTPKAAELREFLRQFDFNSITPRQMAHVGGHLFEREAISEYAASAFIGVEHNLVDEMDPDKPIDMNAHFKRMLDAATAANASEPGYFDHAVRYRQEATKALADVMSFVTDERSRVST